MRSKKYCVKNKTRDTNLSSSVATVDTTLEPLTVLRVVVEGLAQNEAAGLWLTRVIGIPSVPRIAPFDLVYLDREYQVVDAVELLPAAEIPRFKSPAVTALVLPSQTISASGTHPGDQLELSEAQARIEPLDSTESPVIPAAAFLESEAAPLMIPLESTTEFAVQLSKAQHRSESPGEATPPEEKTNDSRIEAPLPQPAQTASELTSSPAASPASPRQSAETLSLDLLSQLRTSSSQTADRAAPPETIPPPRPSVPASPEESAPAAAAAFATEPKQPFEPEPLGNERKIDRFMRWLYPGVYGHERRTSIRRPLPGLVAYDSSSENPQKHDVADISSTGIYLRTDERWKPGSIVHLTLQRNGPQENSEEHRVELQAGAVRWGKDGVALSFILPEGMDLDLWEAAVKGNMRESGPEYVVNEIRVASAVRFLRRICPPAAEHAKLMLHKEFSNVRVFSAVKIALKAESLLASQPESENLFSHPEIVVRILDVGSWADVEWIQDYWAGLLASSCTPDGQDESTLDAIDLLGRLAPIHLRILSVACEKTARTMAGLNTGSSLALDSTIEELTRTLDSANPTKIFRAISELCILNLLDKSNKPTAAAHDNAARTMPTQLGMRLYASFLGSRDGLPPIAHTPNAVRVPLASYSEEELFYKSAQGPG